MQNQNIKIFFTSNSLWDMYCFRYGAIKALISDGYDITVIAPNDERIDFKKELNIKHIPVEVTPRGINPINDLKFLCNLNKIYSHEKPNIVFHYTIKPNIYGTIAAKLNKLKNIAVIPGLGFSFIEQSAIARMARLMYKFALKFTTEIWVINKDDKNFLLNQKIVNKDILVLPTEGVNVDKFKPSNLNQELNDKIIFLMIARALYEKGFKEYTEAAKKIKSKYSNVEFLYLGSLSDNHINGVTKQKMEQLENDGVLKYLGFSKDVRNIISSCDCVVLPSYREGASKVLMEASSMEKPIIASNVVGCKDLVENGYNGYLVEAKNSDDLAQKMEKFINLPNADRLKLGINGRNKMIEQFDEKIIIDIYRKKIIELLNQ